MNRNGKKLNLSNSNYANTNGLENLENVSTVYDVAILSMEIMKNEFVNQVKCYIVDGIILLCIFKLDCCN